MPRVSSVEVRSIMSALPADVDVAPFIAAANQVVNRLAKHKNPPSAAELKEVERWLAAHYISSHGGAAQVSKVSDGQSSVTRLGQTGLNLDSTFYGQNAKTLDPTGLLAEIGLKQAVIEVV